MRVLNLLAVVYFTVSGAAHAATVYIRAGASGAANGTDWTNAYTNLPASLVRGNTYYIGDGSYASYSFDDAIGDIITIKKATVADHGTDTGWDNAYGDGKAIFDSTIAFTTGNWVLDGNGTHTVPSKTDTDYGFEIYNATTNSWWGMVQISSTNITLRYIHIHGQYTGADNSGTVGVRWTGDGGRTKLQNCYVQNTGKDGLQLSGAQYVLVERCYLERMGTKLVGTPDVHAQSVQMFYGASDCVFRWNKFDRCEGQSLIAYAGVGVTTRNLRFYGNVVFNAYGTVDTAGFNSSGGIIGNAWEAAELDRILIYNNNWVNLRDEYTTAGTSTHFPIHPNTVIVTNVVNQNNILYNSETSWLSRGTYSHNASGGYGTNAGSLNEQMSLDVGVFQAYTSDDFRLVAPTDAGVVLSGESWWNDDSDEFFGSLDSGVDMYGTTRGSDGLWDRGAFELDSTVPRRQARTTLASIGYVLIGGAVVPQPVGPLITRVGPGDVTVVLEMVVNSAGNNELEFAETSSAFSVQPVPCIVFQRVGDGVLVKMEIIENAAGNNEELYTETSGVSGITPVSSVTLLRRGDLAPVKIEIIENQAGNSEPMFTEIVGQPE